MRDQQPKRNPNDARAPPPLNGCRTFSSGAMFLLVHFAPFCRGRSKQSLVLCVMAPQLREPGKGRGQGQGKREEVRRTAVRGLWVKYATGLLPHALAEICNVKARTWEMLETRLAWGWRLWQQSRQQRTGASNVAGPYPTRGWSSRKSLHPCPSLAKACWWRRVQLREAAWATLASATPPGLSPSTPPRTPAPTPAAQAAPLRLRRLLFACSFSKLRRLEDLDAAVIPLHPILALVIPVTLMLQRGLVRVKVPWHVGHILGNVRVNLLSIFVDLGRGQTSLSGLLQLLLPTPSADVPNGYRRLALALCISSCIARSLPEASPTRELTRRRS